MSRCVARWSQQWGAHETERNQEQDGNLSVSRIEPEAAPGALSMWWGDDLGEATAGRAVVESACGETDGMWSAMWLMHERQMFDR